jgi:hypothetical protein
MMKRWLIALLLMAGAQLRANPLVLAVSYASSDPVLHIGSAMTVYMSAIQATATLAVSVTGATTGQITVAGADLAALAPGTEVFLTDGTHTWQNIVSGGTVSVGNVQMVGGVATPAIQVADYTTLVNYSFRAYTGTLITYNPGISQSEYVDLGSFDSIVLNDQGGNGDAAFGDGLWSGTYFVRALGFAVSSGHLFGNVSVNNVLASNAPFQSGATFSLDGVRPSIDHFQWSTNDPNYSDMLYLSSLCQGTTAPQPTNGFGRFDVTTNKTGVNVQITIDTPTPKVLPPIVIPSGAVSPTGFRVWDGTDGSSPDPVFVQDGQYNATLFAFDSYGVPALTTLSARITVVSMRMVIDNINVSPSVIVLDPATNQANQSVQTSYRITLKNDAGSSIAQDLALLGFVAGPSGPPPPSFSNPLYLPSTVGSQSTVNFLGATGGLLFSGFTGDIYPTSDTDADLFHWFNATTPMWPYPECYLGMTGGTANVSNPVWVADGVLTNDEDGYMGIGVVNGPPTYFYQPYAAVNPTSMSTNKGFGTNITSTGPLSMRIQLQENLATLEAVEQTDPPTTAPNFPDPCTPSATTDVFEAGKIHFESVRTKLRAVDSSVVISAQTEAPLLLDSTPPLVSSSDPQAGMIYLPNVYGGGAGKVLTVNVSDPESGINAATSKLELLDPTGAQVGGVASNSGGSGNSSVLYFTPNKSLAQGGTYILRVTACNGASLCLSQDISFTIKDTASPDVYSVNLTSANQTGTISIYQPGVPQSVPAGPFDTITQLSVGLSMANSSTNTIDGDNSVVALQSINGSGSPVDIPLTRISPLLGQTPAGSRSLTLTYSLNTPITGAGKYQVVVTTYAKDGSGNSYSGPANFLAPQFITQANPLALNITYPSGYLAVTGLLPVTMTVGSAVTTVSNGVPAARAPGYLLLPANSGYTPLNPSDADAGLQWVLGGVPLTTAPIFSYSSSSVLRATLYYNDVDLPSGVSATNLSLFGFNGIGWRQLSPAEYSPTFNNVTRNTFVITLPNGSSADAVYGIFYPASVTSTSSTLAQAVRTSRSFNPNASNPLARVARFYTGTVALRTLDVRVFDTQGRLIRSQSMSSGLVPQVDATSGLYYFTWDGTNDNGNLVRNGVYLVRWQLNRTDGSTDTQTKLVALIK